MSWRCTGRTNAELITNLYRQQLISSERVRNAMLAVDRANYCPLQPGKAYEDSPQRIGFGATISAPHMHAMACESLLSFIPTPTIESLSDTSTDTGTGTDAKLETTGGISVSTNSGARVLDVGCGSGYLTHVLGNIVCGPDGKGRGKVVGIDHIKGLTDITLANMRKSEEGRSLLDSGRVEIVTGDGRKGYAAAGPYDAIHVGAAAVEVHQELLDQLKSPGRLFIPVGDEEGSNDQYIWVVDKDKDGKVTRRRDVGVRYVPLTDAPTR